MMPLPHFCRSRRRLRLALCLALMLVTVASAWPSCTLICEGYDQCSGCGPDASQRRLCYFTLNAAGELAADGSMDDVQTSLTPDEKISLRIDPDATAQCGEPYYGSRHCVADACECQYTEWSQWTQCQCGLGVRTRTRTSKTPQSRCINTQEQQHCAASCNCQVGEWSDWSSCTGHVASQSRFRAVLHAGPGCPPVMETRTCPGVPAPGAYDVSCDEWSQCDLSCMQVRYCRRSEIGPTGLRESSVVSYSRTCARCPAGYLRGGAPPTLDSGCTGCELGSYGPCRSAAGHCFPYYHNTTVCPAATRSCDDPLPSADTFGGTTCTGCWPGSLGGCQQANGVCFPLNLDGTCPKGSTVCTKTDADASVGVLALDVFVQGLSAKSVAPAFITGSVKSLLDIPLVVRVETAVEAAANGKSGSHLGIVLIQPADMGDATTLSHASTQIQVAIASGGLASAFGTPRVSLNAEPRQTASVHVMFDPEHLDATSGAGAVMIMIGCLLVMAAIGNAWKRAARRASMSTSSMY